MGRSSAARRLLGPWAASRHRGRGVGPSFDSRDCARMRVPSAEGGPEARIQTPETQRCQTSDHQITSPPDHQTTGHQDPPGLTRVHVPARASPDPLPPQVSLKAEGEAAATKLELRSKRFAGFTHALHDLQPRPAEKKILCVRESHGSLPAVPRCASGSRGVAARELHGRAGVQARHGCPRPQLAQGGAVLIFRSRPAVACPHCALPHRLQAAAAQRGRRRRHRHGHRHVIATGPSTTPFLFLAAYRK